MKLILGSASPRRLEILQQAHIVPDKITPANIDETPKAQELPLHYCKRIALDKANAISINENEIVLTADTTVAVGRRIMGKPHNSEEAIKFLKLLSGRRHKVITSIVVRNVQDIRKKSVTTDVKFKNLSTSDIDCYIASKEWEGKAGGYAIQGLGAEFIPWISGSYSGVVGLPIAQTMILLKSLGWKP